MSMSISCPSCGRELRMKEEHVGQLVRCPGCDHEFTFEAGRPDETGIRATPDDQSAATETRIRDSEPRPPRSRLSRYDDYEEEEFERRPRRGVDFDRIKARVSGPANGLLAVGWIGIALTVLGVVLNMVGAFAEMGAPGGGGGAMPAALDAASSFVGVPFSVAVCVLIIIGAYKMKNLENHGLAKAAAIIAMIPCISPCCLLGIPVGIQAWNVLNDSEVSAAFRAKTSR